MTDFSRLQSDGTTTTVRPEAEERASSGEELWYYPTTGSGVAVTERTALHATPILAAHNVIASDVSILPLEIYQEMPDGTVRTAREHEVYPLVKRSPNGESPPARWFAALMGHALGFGNGYAEIQRRGGGTSGRPVGLHLLNPRTQIRRDEARKLYYQDADGREYPAQNVIHVAGFGFDGLSGYNFTKFTAEAIGLLIGAQSFAADYFGNGSDPGGVIEHPGRLQSKEAQERLRTGFEGRHQGLGKRHRVSVLEEGAKFTPVTSDPEKSQLTETRRFQAIDATRPYRLAPHKLGDFSEAHLSNIGAANLDYLMTALMAWLVAIEQEFSLKLLSEAEFRAGYFFKHDVAALLRGDIQTRFASYEQGVRNGWLSRNDVRRKEGENPIPKEAGGDLYTVQMQVIPLDQSGEKVAAGPVITPKKDAPTAEPKGPTE
jgi:HK97 family phage portal protein